MFVATHYGQHGNYGRSKRVSIFRNTLYTSVFTVGQTHPIKIDFNQIALIWGVGLAGNACRVKGVKMTRLAITQEQLGRLSPNLVCV